MWLDASLAPLLESGAPQSRTLPGPGALVRDVLVEVLCVWALDVPIERVSV